MGKSWFNILKLTGVYVGLVIGAGFASGREVMTFFTSYGRIWPLGVIVTGILLSAFGYMIMAIVEKNRIKSYSRFTRTVMPEKLAVITEAISGMFLFILFFTMVSACGSLVYEALGIEKIWGVLAMAALSFMVFYFDMDGVIKINAILSPIMVLGAIAVCIYASLTSSREVFLSLSLDRSIPWMIIFSAVLYVSYNIITSVSVFVEAESLLVKDRRIKLSGILGGAVMGILGLFLCFVLYTGDNYFLNFDIPMLKAIEGSEPLFKYIYIVVLIGAIITTAVGNGYGAVKWIEEKMTVRPVIIKAFIAVVSVLFSFFGFSAFTDNIYPIFGLLGLMELFFIFKFFLSDK